VLPVGIEAIQPNPALTGAKRELPDAVNLGDTPNQLSLVRRGQLNAVSVNSRERFASLSALAWACHARARTREQGATVAIMRWPPCRQGP
jgi:hypothetical protein